MWRTQYFKKTSTNKALGDVYMLLATGVTTKRPTKDQLGDAAKQLKADLSILEFVANSGLTAVCQYKYVSGGPDKMIMSHARTAYRLAIELDDDGTFDASLGIPDERVMEIQQSMDANFVVGTTTMQDVITWANSFECTENEWFIIAMHIGMLFADQPAGEGS